MGYVGERERAVVTEMWERGMAGREEQGMGAGLRGGGAGSGDVLTMMDPWRAR